MLGSRRRALGGGGGGALIITLPIGSLLRLGSDYIKNIGNAGESNYYLIATSYEGSTCCLLIRWQNGTYGAGRNGAWDSGSKIGYGGSTLDNYMTGTVYNAFDTITKSYLQNVNVPVLDSNKNIVPISRSVFVPSRKEYGSKGGSGILGTALPFLENESANVGTWVRSEYATDFTRAYYINSSGIWTVSVKTQATVAMRAMIALSPNAKYDMTPNGDGSYNIV